MQAQFGKDTQNVEFTRRAAPEHQRRYKKIKLVKEKKNVG